MIFGLGKKRAEKSFKDRVTEFWNWYPQVSDRFFQTIERGDCRALTDEVSDFMANTLPGMAWVFGPGENDGHSFTVSGEGVVPKQLLAEYWHSRAVKIPNWTFYGSRQPSDPESLKSMAIRCGDRDELDTEGFLIQPNVNEEDKKIDIVAWHPALASVPENGRFHILFLLLDEALGEFGTSIWLGEIKIDPFTADQHTITLAALPEKIMHIEQYYQWEMLPPLRAVSGYQVNEQTDGPRGDSLVGFTMIPNVVTEFLGNGRLEEDPLEGTGASFAYVAIDGSVFPDGKQTDVRCEIEDALDKALTTAASGRTLGGAFGLQQSYIDLILFDGDGSRKIVDETLKRLQLHGRARVESMT